MHFLGHACGRSPVCINVCFSVNGPLAKYIGQVQDHEQNGHYLGYVNTENLLSIPDPGNKSITAYCSCSHHSDLI